MKPLIQMRLAVVHVWRVMRSLRLPYLVFFFLLLISINTLFTVRHQDIFSRDRETLEIKNIKSQTTDLPGILTQDSSDHPKLSLSGLIKPGHSPVSPEPQVKEELSSGVQEEENSAREVLDGDGVGEQYPKHARLEDNAANEINSVEPEFHANGKNLNEPTTPSDIDNSFHELPDHQRVVDNWRNLTDKELSSLSVLGRRLYLNENIGTIQNKNFTILIWKSGPSIEARYWKQYGKEKIDPFRKCSVRNCEIRYEDYLSDTADAILIHLHRTRGPSSFPNRTNLKQRWVWVSDECPFHTFMMAKDKNISHYNGYFNWSMTYKMDSDVPVPYGRTSKMTDAEASLYKTVDYFNLKSKTVAVMGSNCGGRNKRWTYVKELKKHMEVDMYGGCGTLKCPGHFKKDCELIGDYKFYLAFENSDCKEYITEKAWWNGIEKGAVPVVMGGKIEDYRKMMPPNSFIHIDEFQTPEHLAKHLTSLAQDHDRYMLHHEWRSQFKGLNEHGYFQSDVYHYCRLCEALNYNDPAPKVYDHMEEFWNTKDQCYPYTWKERMEAL